MKITVVLNVKNLQVYLFNSKKMAGIFTGCTQKTVRKNIISGRVVKRKWIFSQPVIVRYRRKKRQSVENDAFFYREIGVS